MTPLNPPHSETDRTAPAPVLDVGRYLDVALPAHFGVESLTLAGTEISPHSRLTRDTWLGGNSYLAEDCKRLDDGTYQCGNRGGGSGFIIRCVAQLADGTMIHLDGGGRPYRSRLVEIDPAGPT